MIDFYTVSAAYADYLRQFEPKVPQVSYQIHDKFFCGVVLRIGSVDYLLAYFLKNNKKPKHLLRSHRLVRRCFGWLSNFITPLFQLCR